MEHRYTLGTILMDFDPVESLLQVVILHAVSAVDDWFEGRARNASKVACLLEVEYCQSD